MPFRYSHNKWTGSLYYNFDTRPRIPGPGWEHITNGFNIAWPDGTCDPWNGPDVVI